MRNTTGEAITTERPISRVAACVSPAMMAMYSNPEAAKMTCPSRLSEVGSRAGKWKASGT